MITPYSITAAIGIFKGFWGCDSQSASLKVGLEVEFFLHCVFLGSQFG